METKIPSRIRIREAMDARGMNQTDLATLSGLSKSAVSQYIAGKFEPKQNAIYALAKALNVSEAWLMGFDAPMERVDAMNAALSQDEMALINLYSRLDAQDRENVKNYISHVLLVSDKYAVKRGTRSA